tara:strand:- start:1184 stop:1939 length:756 start_codon:yes stop_codon:yes gene_type:complete
MNLKNILIVTLMTTALCGCGSNVFQGFVGETEKNLLESIEDASTTEDYSRLITAADEIINSSTATDAEKVEAHLIKAEAILGKSNITALDIMAELALSADEETNPINVLSTEAPIEDLIAASTSLAAASDLGDSGNKEQNLMKGIVNTMIVMNTITEEFIIDENGKIVNDVSDYSDSLDNIMFPGDQTDHNIVYYSTQAFDGFDNSGALTEEQKDEADTIKQKIAEINTLKGKDETDSNIEDQLKTIFQGF